MRNDCEPHLNIEETAHGQGTLKTGFWFLGLVAGACVIAWPWLAGSVTIPWDAKAQFLPQVQFLAHALARGDSPFWTPNIFAGHPQIADAQSLIFSPPFLLLALLDAAPTAWAMDVTLYVCLAASACAFFAWMTAKGIAPHAAFIAALSFAFGASMAWRVQHTGQVLSLAYLPFVLFYLDKAVSRGTVLAGALAGLFAAFIVLGRDQVGLLCVYFLIAYVGYGLVTVRTKNQDIRKTILPLAAGGVTGSMVIALPILMTVLLAQDSNRPAIDLLGAGRGSLHPGLFLTALAPDVFGSSGVQKDYWGPPSFYWKDTGLYIAQNMGQLYFGATAALALLWGLASGRLLHTDARLFLAAFLTAVLYALGWYTPVFAWLHTYVPGVDLYRRPADATFMIGFFAAVLAGYALDGLFAHNGRAKGPPLAVALFLAIGFGIMCVLAWRADRFPQAWPHILVPMGLFATSATLLFLSARCPAKARAGISTALAAFTIADLAYSNGPGGATALPPATYDVLEPQTTNATLRELSSRTLAATPSQIRRDRVEIVGLGFHWPNVTLSHDLEHTLGYNPVRLSWVNRALGANDTTGLAEQKTFSPLYPSYRSPMADLLGLRWIATGVPVETIDKALQPQDLPLVARTPEAYIYENPRALPRVLFAGNAAPADLDAIMRTGDWPRTDFETTVLLSAEDIAEHDPDAAPRPPGEIRILSYTNTHISIAVNSPAGGYAILNDAWHPWWYARVDGAEVPVLRANGIFRAVKVAAGPHAINFEFRPVSGALRQLRGLSGN